MIHYLTKLIKEKRENKLYYNKYIPKEYCHLTPSGEEYKKVIIENHKKLWDWIIEETNKRKKKVNKDDYFEKYSQHLKKVPKNKCFLCEYAEKNKRKENYHICDYCLASYCFCFSNDDHDELYELFTKATNWKKSIKLAEKIRDIIEG
jgi:hypothetical protein